MKLRSERQMKSQRRTRRRGTALAVAPEGGSMRSREDQRTQRQRQPRRIGTKIGGERVEAGEEKVWIALGKLGFSRLALGGIVIVGDGW
jgi:hypothetical protein